MKYIINQEQTWINIADAVREKAGTTDPIAIEDIAEAIENIPTGGSGGGGGETHTVTVSFMPIYNGDDWYEISAQSFDEILEYYAAGYHLEVTSQNSDSSYMDNYTWYLVKAYSNIIVSSSYVTKEGAAFYMIGIDDSALEQGESYIGKDGPYLIFRANET